MEYELYLARSVLKPYTVVPETLGVTDSIHFILEMHMSSDDRARHYRALLYTIKQSNYLKITQRR